MSKKLSKSTAIDPKAVEELVAVLKTMNVADHYEGLALDILKSDWLRDERRYAFWDGVHELGMLTGSIDDYTMACIVDPYKESK